MQTIALLLLAALATVLACAWLRRSKRTTFANIGEGTRESGNITKLTDAALASRFLLVIKGTDDAHVAVAASTDEPWGCVTDEAAGAEEPVNVAILSCKAGTIRMVTDGGGALAIGDNLVPATGGKVKIAGTTAATKYFIVGKAMSAAAATDGIEVEVAPIGAWKTMPA